MLQAPKRNVQPHSRHVDMICSSLITPNFVTDQTLFDAARVVRSTAKYQLQSYLSFRIGMSIIEDFGFTCVFRMLMG